MRFKTDVEQLKRELKQVALEIRTLKAKFRRVVQPAAPEDYAVYRGVRQRVRKKVVLMPGRAMTFDESRQLISLKAKATMLCAVRAVSRGKVHRCQYTAHPRRMRAVLSLWETYQLSDEAALEAVKKVA